MTRVADRTVELTVMTSEEQNNPKNQKDANDKVDPQMRLDGNEAINLAEKQAKKTADKNIPQTGLGKLPVPDDTANLRYGPNLNDGLLGVLPLIGVWRGEGQAVTADGQHTFGQEIIFSHNGENHVKYESRTWFIDENGKPAGASRRETGYLRIDNKDAMELTYTSSDGIVEIMYGQPHNERSWELQSASTMVTETGPKTLGPGKRLYGLMPNNDLGWVDERVTDGELAPYMSAQLQRVAG